MTPLRVSNSQPQTTVAVIGGIAHASRSPAETITLTPRRSRVISRAISTPRTIVATTQTSANTMLRANTCQKAVSESTAR